MIKKYSFILIAFLCFGLFGYGQTYNQITSLAELTDGYYVIAESGENYAMNNTHNGTYLGRTGISPVASVITNPPAAIIWRIETNGTGRTIYSENSTKYISYTGSSNNVQIVDNVNNNNQRWNITYSGGYFIFSNLAVTSRDLQYNSGAPRFACYTGSQNDLALYKLNAPSGPTITVTQATGGTIAPGTTSVTSGDDQAFTATADPCYTFTNWIVDGSNAGSTNPYTFTNVTVDHTITAVYTRDTYNITASAGANGSISPTGVTSVGCGDNQTYTITPDGGYAVDDVLVDGVSVGAVTSYTFSSVAAAHSISATFVVYVGPCGSESFDNIGPYGGYQTETWVGDNGFGWTATDARTDQAINGKAITIRNGNLTSASVAGGIGNLTLTTKLPFSDPSGNLTISVNGSNVGNVPYSSSSQTSTIPNINIGGNVIISIVSNNSARISIDDLSWTCYSATPEPEIEIQGNGTEIVNGANSPNFGDNTDFGNVAVVGGTNPNTFTITNTGTADLDVTSIATSNAEFALSGTTSGIITPGNSITFTVTFDPSIVGPQTSTITVTSDDADEGTYTFLVAGNGTNSNASDIIESPGFTYTNNIPYINYQAAGPFTNTTGSVGVFRFDIRDGGATNDTDNLGTELNSITFNVGTTHINYIRNAGLFDGLAMRSNNPTIDTGAGTITFSGLTGANFTAVDNGTLTLTLRVSFTENVTDNEKLIFNIIDATANTSGSVFAANDAGGAFSDNNAGNDRNRIEVVATKLQFAQQPSNTAINVNMLPAPAVEAVDELIDGATTYNNRDLDFNSSISLSSSGTVGTMNGDPLSITAASGLATFSGGNSVVHPTADTNRTLNASSPAFGATQYTSDLFDILLISYGYNTYLSRTGSGSYTDVNSWSKCGNIGGCTGTVPGAGGWGALGASGQTPNSGSTVFIQGTITLSSSLGITNSTIFSGGNLIVNGQHPVSNSMLVQTGGALTINSNFNLNNSTATFTVEDNADVYINYKYNNPVTSIWSGIELFHPESNLTFRNWDGDDDIIPNNAAISTNTFSGYTAVFGNIIFDFDNNLDASDDITVLNSGVNINLAHGDLIFRTNDFGPPGICSSSSVNKFRISNNGTVTSGIGGDFIVEDSFYFTGCFNTIQFKSSGTLNFTIGGNMSLDQATTRLGAGTNPQTTLNIEGNLDVLSGAFFDMQATISGGSNQTINLYGNYYAENSGHLRSTNSNVNNNKFNFVGSSIQTIDVASTSATEHQYITFNIENGAYVQLINRDFELGRNSSLNVKTGGTLDFGFDGITALHVARSGTQTGTVFESEQGSTLKITSPDGITTTAGLGNVQTTPSSRTFNQTANFYYIGKQNQVTGNALTVGGSVKNVYAVLDNNSLELRLTNRTGISDGGKLEIQQGIVIGVEVGPLDTDDLDFYGDDGVLIMTGGEYRISTITANPLSALNGYLPKLRKYAGYSLTGGTVHLNGDLNTQILSGVPTYYNLSFSGDNKGGIPVPPPYNYKGISKAVSITNNVIISETAILDVEDKTFGGSGTNLYMEDQSLFVMAGTGTKPDAFGGIYALAPTSTIEFNNNGGFEEIRLTNPIPNYANIVVSGSNVGTTALGDGPNSFIQFQPNGSFTVTNVGTFKHSNSYGFSTLPNTAISNANNPSIILLDESTIEYAGANQTITPLTTNAFATNDYYANLTLSGSGTKTLGHATDVIVGEDLNVNSSTLIVDTDEAITVDESVNVATAGLFDIKNSGSLIQINDLSPNTGKIQMERKASIKNLDYVYWSSPITGYNVSDIGTTNKIYKWNPTASNATSTQGNWVSAVGDIMEIGKGYIVRAPNGQAPPTNPGDLNFTALFSTPSVGTGVPHNGEITVPISRGSNAISANDLDDNWNLVGNPYPSAISADKFIAENNSETYGIDGYLNIWKHGLARDGTDIPFYQNHPSGYHQADYFYYNSSGSTDGPASFTGYIAAGQSFMVNMVDGANAASGNIVFKNDMRDRGYANNQFFRTPQSATTPEKHRIWLDLITPDAPTNRVLVGYIEGATMAKDRIYDAEISLTTTSDGLYSLIDNEPYIIQGRSLPFSETDVIPLGLKVSEVGNYSIAIGAVDGLFETDNQTIYLKDYNSNFIHNLSLAPYSFTSETGEFNERFEIVFNSTLSTGDHFMDANDITIIELQNGAVQINVGKTHTIVDVEILDVTGRRIYKLKGNSSVEVYDLSNLSKAAYIAKVTLSNDQVISKKAMKQR